MPSLFGRLLIPEAVLRELRASATPQVVREWMANPPEWLEIRAMTETPDQTVPRSGYATQPRVAAPRGYPGIEHEKAATPTGLRRLFRMRSQRSAEPQRWALFRNRFAVNLLATVIVSGSTYTLESNCIACYPTHRVD